MKDIIDIMACKMCCVAFCFTLLLSAHVKASEPDSDELASQRYASAHSLIKERYLRFLTGTDDLFQSEMGEKAADLFLLRLRRPIDRAVSFDFSQDAGRPFLAFPEDVGHHEERAVYSPILQEYLLSLAYGFCVDAPGSPHYRNPDVLDCYIQCLDYLHGRGIRDGMTFHNNEIRMNMDGAPKPSPGAANLAEMELRMGALCQSVLLMEPFFKETTTFSNARALVRHLEMLGRTSGHVRYYEPYENPPEFRDRVQSDAIQNYCDTTLVSSLLENDPERRHVMLLEAQRILSDSLKVVPGWADTIKPDFTGFHHRGIYGNAYTGGFIPQAAFGVFVLRDTPYAVEPESVANLKKLILTYRLYCQKYSMPFGIRGRMPLSTDHLKTTVFTGLLLYASSLGLDDDGMKPVFSRLWDDEEMGLDFLFIGGRGKAFRGLYGLEMLESLIAEAPRPEADPTGFFYKPYGGLALHRRDDWMAAIKGCNKYVWDYENGEPDENVYGQYVSHGMLTIFAKGDPISDIESGYRLDQGWDWYRLPGVTGVHFPVEPQGPLEHRRFSSETFLGAVSCDNLNGVWGMILNQPTFADGTRIDLHARKSAFFVDDLILLLGSGISGGDGVHPVETTLFQTFLDETSGYRIAPSTCLADPVGNGYLVRNTDNLQVFQGEQKSYRHNGRTPTEGEYAVAWLDHGVAPRNASYEAAILVRGADRIERLAANPDDVYRVVAQTEALHHVDFPGTELSSLVFFEPGESSHPIVSQSNEPCLVMARMLNDARIRIGVVNPDLGFLPPDAAPTDYRWVSRNENQYLPSQPRPVRITLRGNWRPASSTQDVTVLQANDEQSVLCFNCMEGNSVQVYLERPSGQERFRSESRIKHIELERIESKP